MVKNNLPIDKGKLSRYAVIRLAVAAFTFSATIILLATNMDVSNVVRILIGCSAAPIMVLAILTVYIESKKNTQSVVLRNLLLFIQTIIVAILLRAINFRGWLVPIGFLQTSMYSGKLNVPMHVSRLVTCFVCLVDSEQEPIVYIAIAITNLDSIFDLIKCSVDRWVLRKHELHIRMPSSNSVAEPILKHKDLTVLPSTNNFKTLTLARLRDTEKREVGEESSTLKKTRTNDPCRLPFLSEKTHLTNQADMEDASPIRRGEETANVSVTESRFKIKPNSIGGTPKRCKII